jgi:hypothetical protein
VLKESTNRKVDMVVLQVCLRKFDGRSFDYREGTL